MRHRPSHHRSPTEFSIDSGGKQYLNGNQQSRSTERQ